MTKLTLGTHPFLLGFDQLERMVERTAKAENGYPPYNIEQTSENGFRITLHTFHACYRAGTVQHLGVMNHAWVTLADVDHYAFAVTDQKIIAALRANERQLPLL